MCLAVPLKLLRVNPGGFVGIVDLGGAERAVGLDLVPEAVPGNFLLIHAGMAIQVISDEDAELTLESLREFASIPGMISPDAEHGPGKN